MVLSKLIIMVNKPKCQAGVKGDKEEWYELTLTERSVCITYKVAHGMSLLIPVFTEPLRCTDLSPLLYMEVGCWDGMSKHLHICYTADLHTRSILLCV